jgi:6,7-dimethyl-8-ribityllumazine synthase
MDFTGAPDMTNRRVAIVVSRFNESVTMRLLQGAIDALERHGGKRADNDVVGVPGAWELPAGARALLATERYDALIALGAVIRGETPHFEFVAGEASRGLAQAGAEFEVPIGFGLLTTDSLEQADARAGGAHGTKGWDAALAAIEMVDLFERLRAREG